MTNRFRMAAMVILGIAVAASTVAAAQKTALRGQQRIEKEVRHELLMLPYYNVFDILKFQVNGDTVTLTGQVTRPTLKSDAGNVVKGIEGVNKVVNNIEVLPPSTDDDRIRIAEFRAIYGFPALQKYAVMNIPAIHIIVNKGRVTLEGVVNNETDKNLAYVQANGVPGVFGVTNNLQVEGKAK